MKNTIKLVAVGGLVLWMLGVDVQAGLGLNWATPSGLVQADGITPLLESGSALFQLVYAGGDSIADPPTVGGGVSGDDEVLAQQVADASTAGSFGQHFAATYVDPAWSFPAFVYVRIFDRGTSIGNVPSGTAYFQGVLVAADSAWSWASTYQEISEGPFAGGASLDGMGRYVLNQQVGGGPQPEPPALEITTANATVGATVSNLMVTGTSSNLTGLIRWTNSLTGMSDALAEAPSWSFMASLGTGTNVITASGSNSVGDVAADAVTVIRMPAPALDVTNTAATVRYSVADYSIGGTIGNGVAGSLRWTNSLTGASGTASAVNPFTIASIVLDVGENVITVRGTNLYGDVGADTVTITRGGIGTDLPVVDISTPDQGVGDAISSFEVSGTANPHVIGQIAWSNSLGGTGNFATAANWSFSAPLAVGANTITVRGTNLWGETSTDVVILTRAASAAEPYLNITNANETVEHPVGSLEIGGISSNLIGLITWTNSLTGLAGTLAAASPWAFTADLAVGTNVITARGTNLAGQVASDTVTLVRLPADSTGQTTLILGSGQQHLIRYDYDGSPPSTTLNALIGQQVPPGSQFIWMDVPGQAYWPTVTMDRHGSWGPQGSTTLYRGVAYWLRIPPPGGLVTSNQYSVTLGGTIPAEATTITAAGDGKFSPLGYPYPQDAVFGRTALAAAAPMGSIVYFWTGTAFSGGSKSSKGWASAQSNQVIKTGEGFFFKTPSGAPELNVVEPLP